MAKKKSKNKSKSQQQPALSPQRFMREKARNLPIGKCYVAPPAWKEAGMVNVFVTRLRPNGNLVLGYFLVDTFCLGVKNADYKENMTMSAFEEFLRHFKSLGIEEISYDEAHNIIYGAISFAEDGGIQPAKGFETARYILEEDTDDIPLIEYEFGKDGKHLLIVSPDRKEMPYFHILKKNLGENFDFLFPLDYDEEVEDDLEDDVENEEEEDSLFSNFDLDDLKRAFEGMTNTHEEMMRHPSEEYSYQNPDYPETLSVKNQFIADELLSPDNRGCLPREVIDRILALPHDEAAQDLSNIIMYTIGQTYRSINDGSYEYDGSDAIMHSLILLAHLNSDKGTEAVLELMRQTEDFSDTHLGDLAPDLLSHALYACAKDNTAAIEAYLNQPGLYSYLRTQAATALAMIVVRHPERREEIISVFRRLLNNMVKNLPVQRACDGAFAGLLMCSLMDIRAKELIDEIKAVFATDCVDKSIAGDCNEVVNGIEEGKRHIFTYEITDIYDQYESIKRMMSGN